MQPVGLTVTLMLQLFFVLTLLSSAILARPFTENQKLQKFMYEPEAEARQPLAYFESADSVPFYRSGIKRHIQSFADPSNKQLKAVHMLRAMINFRRY
ncbi:hypothetical protein M3Y97_00531000 [Aphelenchoides bicaudatus]|nr:hypothetical protein M3Y97_00531000 [Aphelenchoides bicaudatus]